ncbi:MAG: hypothetical protein COX65_00620 [Elusimicrobia bacterium CG_4_10_14_0_2_um_filter_56_8]|nr:MAG: hypothetical protein AUJ51_01780 [Elusimicrobia bacterium CG1_02_56_21]PJA17667.1 MAG: hypothetical protein COX65_00620 [Elusimicrobia bacterium CG_4_10_14_0_2_um_filter_56_8]
MLKKLKKAFLSFFLAGGSSGTVREMKTAYAPDGRHRVNFFLREEDGVCGFREEFFDDKILEMTWHPMSKEPIKEYPDMDTAIAAAKAEVFWLHLVLR